MEKSGKNSAHWLIPLLSSSTTLLAFWLAPEFPQLEATLKPYPKYALSLLLLMNASHIRYRSVVRVLLLRPFLLGYGILVNNLLLPLGVYVVCLWVWPSVLGAAVLLSGVSSGFSAVSFAILLRLKAELNMLLTLGSSFLMPVSLPFLLYFLVGSTVKIDLPGMMLQTSWMVFVPILLERILYFGLPCLHSWLKTHAQLIVAITLSSMAFIVMLSGQGILRSQGRQFWYLLAFVLFLFALIYACTLLFFCCANLETQLIMLTASLVTNTGMVSVLALEYMGSQTLAISIIFGIVWNFNILFLRSWPLLRNLLYKSRLFGGGDEDLL